MVTESFSKWRGLYKAALSAGLDSFAAQQWADSALAPIPVRARRRAAANYFDGNARLADRYADDY